MARPTHRRGAEEEEWDGELDDELENLPLPDRTRVEASPFYEGEAPTEPPPPRRRSQSRRAPQPPPDEDEVRTNPGSPPPAPSRRVTRMEQPLVDPGHSSEDARTFVGTIPPPPDAADDADATQAGPPIAILVLEGPDAGAKRQIRGGRMVIGRGEGCDLMLSDSSVSRRHLELVAGLNGVVLRDLGSGNGTLVNGEKVGEAQLQHRDRISLGRTVLEVLDAIKLLEERNAPPPEPERPPRPASRSHSRMPARAAGVELDEELQEEEEAFDDDERSLTGQVVIPPRASRSKKPLIFAAAGAAGLLLVAALIVFVRPAPPEPEPVVDTTEERFAELIQQSRNLLREMKYDEALVVLEEARELKETSEVMRQIEAARRERDSNRMLAAARGLAADYRYDEAIDELKKIPETSLAYDEARKLLPEYEEAKLERAAQAVRDAAAEHDFEQARALLAALPPGEASALAREVDAAEKQAKIDAAREAAEQKRAAARRRRARARRAQAEVDAAIAGVVSKVDAGNFDGALRELDRVAEKNRAAAVQRKVRLLRRLIPQFGKTYDEAINKYNAGALEIAAGLLQRSLKLYRDMDIDGKLERGMKQRLSRALLAKGRAAMARQEYGVAAKTFKDVLRLQPNLREAKVALNDISSKAHEVYLEGYVQMQRSPDAARRKFLEVMEMVPPSDKNYQDAKRRLAQLEKGP